MNYLTELLKDCSKNRSTTFAEISFPIAQEIENKIKNKNNNLRKKMKQRLADMQKNQNVEEKRQQNGTLSKKTSNSNKSAKDTLSYIEAYTNQNNTQNNSFFPQFERIDLDEKEAYLSANLYNLIRKRKPIFKVEQARRRFKSKENLKRQSLKECDCCQRVGRHRCQHTFCQGKCEKLMKILKTREMVQFDDENQSQGAKNAKKNNVSGEKQLIYNQSNIVDEQNYPGEQKNSKQQELNNSKAQNYQKSSDPIKPAEQQQQEISQSSYLQVELRSNQPPLSSDSNFQVQESVNQHTFEPNFRNKQMDQQSEQLQHGERMQE